MLVYIYTKFSKIDKFERYFPEIMSIISVLPIYLIIKYKTPSYINIDYTSYIITVVSIMLGFYFSNIFTISSAPKDSIIGKLSPTKIEQLYSYNKNAIRYAILLIISYLLLRKLDVFFVLFYVLTISNIFSGIRIYFFMTYIAKMDIKQKIKAENKYY